MNVESSERYILFFRESRWFCPLTGQELESTGDRTLKREFGRKLNLIFFWKGIMFRTHHFPDETSPGWEVCLLPKVGLCFIPSPGIQDIVPAFIQMQAALATCQSVISAPAPFRLVIWVTLWKGAPFIPNFRTTLCQFSWLFWMGTWVLNSADGQLHIDGPQEGVCKKKNWSILEDILNRRYFFKIFKIEHI